MVIERKEIRTGRKDTPGMTSGNNNRAVFCSSRIRPLRNFDGIALIHRIIDIVVMKTPRDLLSLRRRTVSDGI